MQIGNEGFTFPNTAPKIIKRSRSFQILFIYELHHGKNTKFLSIEQTGT